MSMVLAAGFLVVLIGGGARFAIGLTLKPIVDELGWPRSDVGLAVGLYFVVTAFATFWAGKLADRMSLRMLLAGGLVISGISVGMMGWMNAPWHALVLYGIVFAAGNGAISTVPVGVMVTRAFTGRTGLANAVVLSGITVGQLVIIMAFTAVLAAIGWRSVFFWLGVLHLVLLLVVMPVIPDERRAIARAAEAPQAGMDLRAAARTRQFWLFIGIFSVCGLDDFFVATHVVAFAQDRGVDAVLAGNILAFMGLTGTVGVIAGGWWGDRSGPVWPTVAAFSLRIAMFALIAVDQSPLSIAVFSLMFGVTFLVTAPLTVLFVRDAFGTRHLGAITGIITMVHQIFGGVGAYAGAAIFDATGRYDIAFFIVLAATVVALILTLCLDRTPRQLAPA
ncbi:MAG TPA: MFS transporter [Xanthobacteraceae bacterium]|nr:MFS transporter [Xanthobacteraceae bacterium]